MKKTLPTASATMAPNSTQSMRLIISRYRLIKVGCPRRTCVLDTLAENLRKNLARDLSSRVAAVFRVFDQYGDRDLWLVVGCEPDKPRAIQALRLAVHGLVVFRGTRLPATASPCTDAGCAVPPSCTAPSIAWRTNSIC